MQVHLMIMPTRRKSTLFSTWRTLKKITQSILNLVDTEDCHQLSCLNVKEKSGCLAQMEEKSVQIVKSCVPIAIIRQQSL